MIVRDIVFFGGSTVILITTITVWYYSRRKNVPEHLRWFWLYPVLGVAISLNSVSHKYFKVSPEVYFYHTQKVLFNLQIALLFQAMLNILQFNKRQRLLLNLGLGLIIVTNLILVNRAYKEKIELYSYLIGCLTLMPFCFIYFRRLLVAMPVKMIASRVNQLFVTGVVLISSVGFIDLALSPYIHRTMSDQIKDKMGIAFIATNISLICFYLIIIVIYRSFENRSTGFDNVIGND